MITLDGFRYRGCAEVLGSEALALNAHGSRVLPLGPHRMEDPTHHLEVSLSQPKAKTSYPDCHRINRRLGLIRTDKRKKKRWRLYTPVIAAHNVLCAPTATQHTRHLSRPGSPHARPYGTARCSSGPALAVAARCILRVNAVVTPHANGASRNGRSDKQTIPSKSLQARTKNSC